MRLRLLLEQTEALAKQIRALAALRYMALAELPGVGPLTAGALAAILRPRSFPDEAALSAYAGVVPLQASSADRVRHRLNRGGDRRSSGLTVVSPTEPTNEVKVRPTRSASESGSGRNRHAQGVYVVSLGSNRCQTGNQRPGGPPWPRRVRPPPGGADRLPLASAPTVDLEGESWR